LAAVFWYRQKGAKIWREQWVLGQLRAELGKTKERALVL